MKKTCILLALLLLLGCLAGCGASAQANTPEEPDPETSVQPSETNEPSQDCRYTIQVFDGSGNAAAGVVINFCTDLSCRPVTTDENGRAVFTGAPDRYHVQVIKVPGGLQVDGDAEWYTEPYEQSFQVLLKEADA